MASHKIVPIDGICQTTVQGALDFDATAAILLDIARDSCERGRHLLIDLRSAEAKGLSYVDVYHLVQMLSEHPDAFNGRLALLDLFREGFEKVQFFEASAVEEGFEVHAFLDEDAAVRWLERKPRAA